MGVPKGRRTKSKQGHRRSQIKIKTPHVGKCSRCSVNIVPHRVCTNCGYYKDRQVIDVLKKLTKRERKEKEKELETEQPSKTQ